jgi:hypothetical protein
MATYAVPQSVDYDPREYLAKFLWSVEQQLLQAFEEPRGHLIPESVWELALAALQDVRPMFGRMVARLENADANFADYGLMGVQLQFKLTVISAQSVRYDQAIAPSRAAHVARAVPRLARGIFKKLLEYIDIVLKSIIAALGLGEAVSEFKDFIEKLTPDDFGENS